MSATVTQAAAARPELGSGTYLRVVVLVRLEGCGHPLRHREVHLAPGAATVCKLALHDVADDVTGRRVIIHLRQPAPRVILERLAVTLT